MQPTATHVEALTGNFLDGEFDPPPSPPVFAARDENVAGDLTSKLPSQLPMKIQLVRSPQLATDQRSIKIGDEEVTYILQRSARRRRTIQLQMDPDSGFKLLVPHTISDHEIEHFLLARSDWILKHRPNSSEQNDAHDWATGGTTTLRGKPLNVTVQERGFEDPGWNLPPTVVKSLEADAVAVIIPPGIVPHLKSEVILEWLAKWYRQEALDHFKTRVKEFGNLMGLQPKRLKLSNAKRRWGSCSAKQSINLNWRLILLDDSLIDYVIVHELAHLTELNHSADFWLVVQGVIPDHLELRHRLREHSPSVFG